MTNQMPFGKHEVYALRSCQFFCIISRCRDKTVEYIAAKRIRKINHMAVLLWGNMTIRTNNYCKKEVKYGTYRWDIPMGLDKYSRRSWRYLTEKSIVCHPFLFLYKNQENWAEAQCSYFWLVFQPQNVHNLFFLINAYAQFGLFEGIKC